MGVGVYSVLTVRASKLRCATIGPNPVQILLQSQKKSYVKIKRFPFDALLQILLGRGIHIDFSSQLKFAKIGFYGAFHL